MADIDLKTLTPDTSLPTTGFLFGADSQASASPSVYSTQTVATTLLGSTSLTGATITTSQPVLDLAQTWNAGAVTFTGLRFNAAGSSDANSAAGSLLMDLQVGGSSKFKVSKAGDATAENVTARRFKNTDNTVNLNGQDGFLSGNSSFQVSWTSSSSSEGTRDLFLTRRGTANLRLGAADAAAPVTQTLSVQSVVAGTSNTAGANLTITGSQGTGTGAGGSIIFQVAPAGSSGTAQNALATALTIASNKNATFEGSVTGDNGGFLSSWGGDGGAGLGYQGLRLGGASFVGWAPVAPSSGTFDTRLYRDTSNTLALRNGGTSGAPVPQTFRVYNWTDGTNSEWGLAGWVANEFVIGTEKAGTGTNRSLSLVSAANVFITRASGSEIRFYNGASVIWKFDGSGHFLAQADNSYDIGASGANRPRNVFVAGQLTSASIFTGTLNGVIGSTTTGPSIRFSATGNTIILYNNDNTQNDFSRLQFGGISASYPALKRSSTTLQARLADDSGFASVQGKLTTDTAYTAGDPTTTGYLVVYDSAGTAYKIPAVAV